jgi:hypothetical protein
VNAIFIPKPGRNDYTDRRAFRPISLMSVLFKTLERLVLWHIEETSLNRHPMHGSQYGFHKGKSTDQALSKAVDIIEKGINQNRYVLGVFCDISGAFDNVLHISITTAMKSRGISDNIIGWYDHFLQTGTVTSSLGESNPSIRPGKNCPQGGVLSVIISWNIVFDNFLKLYDNSEITSIGFAEDGTLLITGICIHTMYSRMQEALNRAAAWATEHGLSFFTVKTSKTNLEVKHDFVRPKSC